MNYKLHRIIASLLPLYASMLGNLIVTGNPTGVGAVAFCDVLRGAIGDFDAVNTRIV